MNKIFEKLQKDHVKTFKDIDLYSQLDKLCDEFDEYLEAENALDIAREYADMIIVIVGIGRFHPRLAYEYLMTNLIKQIIDDDFDIELVLQLALEKSDINKKRKWKKLNGKYQHEEIRG